MFRALVLIAPPVAFFVAKAVCDELRRTQVRPGWAARGAACAAATTAASTPSPAVVFDTTLV